MKREKLLKLIRIFFVLFILSGIGTIIDYYYWTYPQMFTRLFNLYEIVHLNHVSINIPGVPLIQLIFTIWVFLLVIRRLYRLIVAEIKKEI